MLSASLFPVNSCTHLNAAERIVMIRVLMLR